MTSIHSIGRFSTGLEGFFQYVLLRAIKKAGKPQIATLTGQDCGYVFYGILSYNRE